MGASCTHLRKLTVIYLRIDTQRRSRAHATAWLSRELPLSHAGPGLNHSSMICQCVSRRADLWRSDSHTPDAQLKAGTVADASDQKLTNVAPDAILSIIPFREGWGLCCVRRD